jgi:hypothetical protein
VQDRRYGDGIVTMSTTLGARQARQLLSVAEGVRIGDTPLGELMDTLWPLVSVSADTCRIAVATRWSAP